MDKLINFYRANPEVICEKCGKKYIDHPLSKEWVDWEGNLFLHELCDGQLVKL